ncbi:MAG: septal ring lytic transglycosylase RlpA family protein [Methylacidiphilales bacterium]|nr:septal ring lytic transglycosylase RlpA family protein [Candidatus Methylacidiphilales bacterium]
MLRLWRGAACSPPARPARVSRGGLRRCRPPRWSAPQTGRKAGAGQRGIASYYWQDQRTASGERFNPNALTAAHRTLPLGTVVRVTNHRNGSSVRVRINDRGPYVRGRVIDLSRAAAQRIGMISAGLTPVTVQIVD